MLTFACLLLVLPASFAEGDVVCGREDLYGRCEVIIIGPGLPGTEPQPGPSPTKPATCQLDGEAIPCVKDGRTWRPSYSAWCKLADPQPPKTDSLWQGQTSGAILDCQHPFTTAQGPFFKIWSPGAEERPDPAVLARQAVASMNLKAIDIGIVPRTMEDYPRSFGWVGMKVWMWAENPDATTWGPKTATASLGSYSVSATARVSHVTWDMGDGSTVTCRTPGTSWSRYKARDDRSSPDCGYVYEREAPTDAGYPVTATSHWQVTWQGMGESGTIEFTLDRTVHVMIGEIQVLSGGPR